MHCVILLTPKENLWSRSHEGNQAPNKFLGLVVSLRLSSISAQGFY